VFALASAGLPRGYQPRPLSAHRVDHDKNSTQRIHTECDEPLFALRIRIVDRHNTWIAQGLFGMREINAVPAAIRHRLAPIKLDVLEHYAYPICIGN
jgi:hypothetical protein